MIIRMELGESGYDIVLERGCLQKAGEQLNLDRKVFILTDEGVPAQYAQTVADQCKEPHIHTVPQGEGSKSFAVLEELLTKMMELGFTRGGDRLLQHSDYDPVPGGQLDRRQNSDQPRRRQEHRGRVLAAEESADRSRHTRYAF